MAASTNACVLILLSALSGCGHHEHDRPPVDRAVPVAQPDPADDDGEDDEGDGDDGEGDGDGDRIRDACDRCPDAMEVYNAILDFDGCPDSSGTSHAVANHPTNRFAYPYAAVDFGRDSSEVPDDIQDRLAGRRFALTPEIMDAAPVDEVVTDLIGAEEGACVGTIGLGEPAALGLARARALCALLEAKGLPPELLTVRDSGMQPVLVADDPSTEPQLRPPSLRRAVWIITRVDGTQIWRWRGRSFTRATPRATLQYDPPLSAECEGSY